MTKLQNLSSFFNPLVMPLDKILKHHVAQMHLIVFCNPLEESPKNTFFNTTIRSFSKLGFITLPTVLSTPLTNGSNYVPHCYL